MKKMIAVLAVLIGLFAVPAKAQDLKTKERDKVTVMFSFVGTKASPQSQMLISSGNSVWWGIAIDSVTPPIIPGEYVITTDSEHASIHLAYFDVVSADGTPSISKYIIYELASCESINDAKNKLVDGAYFGCVLPEIITGKKKVDEKQSTPPSTPNGRARA